MVPLPEQSFFILQKHVSKYIFVFILWHKALKIISTGLRYQLLTKKGLTVQLCTSSRWDLPAFLTHSCRCSVQHNFTFWVVEKIKNILLFQDTKYKEILMCTMSYVLKHKAHKGPLIIKEHYLLQNSWVPLQGRGSRPQISFSALLHQNPSPSWLL